MENKYFNRELCKRFVNDNNLPIPILTDSDKFFYYVNLYEGIYGSKSLWDEMVSEIEKNFKGNSNLFLEHFYQVRDKMITDILENPKYKEFNNVDMKQFQVCEKLKNVPKGNVYTCDNIGKCFVSIDLKKANFQAMKFFDKSLVQNSDNYRDYVKHYTNSEYMINSKYTRQVVFGKCNASRQITIEKYLMSKFYEMFKYSEDMLKLVRFNNDELVFEVVDDDVKNYHTHLCNCVTNYVENTSIESGVDVSCTIYHLSGFCLHSHRKDEDRKPFYVLHNLLNGKIIFKEVPQTYHAITYKLLNRLELTKNDYYFQYEGLDAYIDDYFTLKFIDKKDGEEK